MTREILEPQQPKVIETVKTTRPDGTPVLYRYPLLLNLMDMTVMVIQ